MDDTGKRFPCPDCGSIYRVLSFGGKFGGNFGGSVVLDDATPTLLMQVVVEKGEKTDEGEIVIAVTLPWYDIVKRLKKDPQFAYQMTPRMWEEMVAGIYDRAGFDKVILTPYKAGGGRDVIAIKKGIGTIRVIDQVKAYAPRNLVTHDHVRGLVGVVEMDGASKGFLTTTSDFAPTLREDPLIKPYLGRRIELINGEMLFNRLRELSGKK